MYVDSVELDYNNGTGKDMMCIKRGGDTQATKNDELYAVYYEGK